MSQPTATLPAGQPTPEAGVEPDGIDTPTLVLWGFVSIVITICVMLIAAALFFWTQNILYAERVVAPRYLESDQVYTDQQGVLTSYGPPASEGQPYKIPIAEAKKLVLAELQADPSQD